MQKAKNSKGGSGKGQKPIPKSRLAKQKQAETTSNPVTDRIDTPSLNRLADCAEILLGMRNGEIVGANEQHNRKRTRPTFQEELATVADSAADALSEQQIESTISPPRMFIGGPANENSLDGITSGEAAVKPLFRSPSSMQHSTISHRLMPQTSSPGTLSPESNAFRHAITYTGGLPASFNPETAVSASMLPSHYKINLQVARTPGIVHLSDKASREFARYQPHSFHVSASQTPEVNKSSIMSSPAVQNIPEAVSLIVAGKLQEKTTTSATNSLTPASLATTQSSATADTSAVSTASQAATSTATSTADTTTDKDGSRQTTPTAQLELGNQEYPMEPPTKVQKVQLKSPLRKIQPFDTSKAVQASAIARLPANVTTPNPVIPISAARFTRGEFMNVFTPPLVKSTEELRRMKEKKHSSAPKSQQLPHQVSVQVSRAQAQKQGPCNCRKSQCLKLYCQCFASGLVCQDCNCRGCMNKKGNHAQRAKAIQELLLRKPNAFESKVVADDAEQVRHKFGCRCKKSACLKKYCECFQAGVTCSDACSCVGCKNDRPHGDGANFEGEESMPVTAKSSSQLIHAE